jgi:hypothetical protein
MRSYSSPPATSPATRIMSWSVAFPNERRRRRMTSSNDSFVSSSTRIPVNEVVFMTFS